VQPVLATYSIPPERVKITMSGPVVPGAPHRANWYVRYSNNSRIIDAVSADGSVVTISLGFGSADPGPNVVSYSPPPHDLVSLYGGEPVAAWADWPILPP